MDLSRLKDLREDHDLTQKEVAALLHITQQQYSRYELQIREIPVHLLYKLALYYNTSTDYILGLTNQREKYPSKRRVTS